MEDWDNWDDLKFVLALANSGSITRAAKALGSSPATVSRKIHSANESYGQSIFQRHQDGWQLTAQGLPLYELAKNFETSLRALQKPDEEEQAQKPLLLTSLDFLIRTVLFPNFHLLREKNPFIELTLHSSNENLSLAYGEADLAIRLARPTSGRLVGRKLADFSYSIYGLEGGDHSNWIGREEKFDYVPESAMANQFFGKSPILRVANYKASLEAIKSMGYSAVLPDIIAKDVPGLVKIDETHVVKREAWLVMHEDRKNDKAIRAVIDWLDICFEAYTTKLMPT